MGNIGLCYIFDSFVRGHPFSTYAKFSEKLAFLSPDTQMYVCVSGGRNVSFSKNFAYVLNRWPLKQIHFLVNTNICKTHCPWKLIYRFSDIFYVCFLIMLDAPLLRRWITNFEVKLCINHLMMTIFVQWRMWTRFHY